MPDRAAIKQFIKDVGVDAALELFELFKTDAQYRLSEIQAHNPAAEVPAQKQSDFRRHAHSLKGICRNYGLPDSGDLAYALETAIDSGDRAAIVSATEHVLAEVPGEIDAAMKLAHEILSELAEQPGK